MGNPEKFGKYILLEKLATGGMAEVYLARAPSAGGISKFVAIKRILPQFSENEEFIQMFKDEAKIAINLNHSNIVSIFEFGIETHQLFLVMDYVEGRNLRQILNKLKKSPQKLSTEQILYIIKEVAAGLDNAHRCLDGATGRPLNITHRDMSPQNVMISFEGEVKIVDFGIAKAESQLETTRAGTLKGKFGYMSPEQVEGQTVDLRTDIFSLGITLWELLANDRLFIANNEINTLRKIRDCQIPSLRKINPNIPQELDRIVNKSLARDRNLRYQTAAAFHKDLNRFLNRQYPDFSPQDFSVFIKTLFANEILETRKRLIDYSKASVEEPAQQAPQQKEITATLTSTNSNADEEGLKLSPSLKKVDLGNLKVNRKEVIRKKVEFKPSSEQALGTETDPMLKKKINPNTFSGKIGKSSKGRSGSVITSVRRRPKKKKGSGFRNLIVAGFFAAGMWYISQPTPESGSSIGSSLGSQPTTPAEPETHSLFISTTPSQAEIFIDGKKLKNATPVKIRVPKNKVITLEAKRPGHITFRQRYEIIQDSSLKIPLQKELVGYLAINVIPNTGVTSIYINGEKIHQPLPISNYAVAAGSRIAVKAINPYTGAEDEKLVVVDKDQKKTVILRLRGKRVPSNNKKIR